jgi:hypothetical protein
MTPTGPRGAPRELKPGDLYLVTGDVIGDIHATEIGQTVCLFGAPGQVRIKLLERHPRGALEFLVLPEVK